MGRRLLPPDPWGITPRAQRVESGSDPNTFYAAFPFSDSRGIYTPMANPKAQAAVASLFQTAPQNRSKASQIRDAGQARAAAKADTAKPEPQTKPAPRRSTKSASEPLKRPPTDISKEIDLDALPLLSAPWMKIQERVFTLADPEAEHEELEAELKLTDALTPGNLEQALNAAEDNARRAHRMYVVARCEFELFELEMTPVVEAMRDAANQDLQFEKAKGERSKAITDADVKGRASILFPDEWGLVQERRRKAEGMMDHLKVFADVWKQRCYSLSALVNAGKR